MDARALGGALGGDEGWDGTVEREGVGAGDTETCPVVRPELIGVGLGREVVRGWGPDAEGIFRVVAYEAAVEVRGVDGGLQDARI